MDGCTDRPTDPSNVWWEKQNVNQQVYDNTERSNRRFTLPLFKSSPSLIKFLLTWLDSGETLLRTMIAFSIHALVSHRHSRHSMEKLVSPCRWWCSKTTVLWLDYLMLLCQPVAAVAPNLFVFLLFSRYEIGNVPNIWKRMHHPSIQPTSQLHITKWLYDDGLSFHFWLSVSKHQPNPTASISERNFIQEFFKWCYQRMPSFLFGVKLNSRYCCRCL